MKNFKNIFFCILALFILFFIAKVVYHSLEPKAYDFMVQKFLTEKLATDKSKNIYGHDDIVLVVIDEKSIEKYRWPWKRDLNCKIFEYFNQYAQSKVIVHDAIITALDKDAPEADKKYFSTLKKFDNLVEGFMYSNKTYEDKAAAAHFEKLFLDKYGIKNIELQTHIPNTFPSLISSPIEFIDSVQHIGSISMVPSYINGSFNDEKYRTHSYLVNHNGVILPSLVMETFLTINNNPKIAVDDKHIYFPDLNYKISHKITRYLSVVPIKFYKLLPSGYSHKHYSAVDIMDSYDAMQQGKKPLISPDVFKDKIVVIGVNDPLKDGLNDNKPTPLTTNHPAMDIQATCIDNLIHNDFLNVMPTWFNILIAILGMLIVYCIINNCNIFQAVLLTLTLLITYITITALCFYNSIVINVITPIAMSAVMVVIAYIHKYILEEKNKEKVTLAMSRYMSEDVVKNVIKNIDNLGLGGKKAIVTVLFSDIRGFTSMSEKMSAQEVSQLLNEYFSEMEPIVTRHNGIINKFIGDAVMAVFGEPIQDENHPLNAVRCGYEMLQKVEELDKKWNEEGKPVIKIGIGINTGEVFVGNIGSERRMEYTVIGDTVNLASRLESYNKTYKTQILISSSTYEASKEFIEVNEISDVEIRGKSQKMSIYEVKKVID